MQRVRTVVLATALAAALTASCGGPRIPPPPGPVRIPDAEQLVSAYYARINAEDLEGVLALMIREPELVEPFSDPARPTVHRGYREVATFLSQAFRTRDDQVVPEYIRPSALGVEAGWSLHGSDGMGVSGVSRFTVRQGQIARVEIAQRE